MNLEEPLELPEEKDNLRPLDINDALQDAAKEKREDLVTIVNRGILKMIVIVSHGT